MAKYYQVKGPIAPREKSLTFGDPKKRRTDVLLIGRLAELGPTRDVWMDVSGEHVVAIVGKRGSGKSFTLGTIAESLCVVDYPNPIATMASKRAVLLLDTLDIFWTTKLPVADRDPPRVRQQFKELSAWGIAPPPLSVDAWVPAGFQRLSDPSWVQPFYIDVSSFGPYDWSSLMGVDLVLDPMGQLINETYQKVTTSGWKGGGKTFSAKRDYTIAEMVSCIKNDTEILSDYREETRRAVVQRLQSYASYQLMTGKGTPLTALLQPGHLSVLMLNRLNPDLRSVLSGVLIRKIMESRSEASFSKKRLETDHSLTDEQKANLTLDLAHQVPRCWIAVDEAQNIIPSDGKTSAQESVIKLVKEGRNSGLSFIFTTQQPDSIEQKIMSQVTTFVVHQLAIERDIDYVMRNLLTKQPQSIVYGREELDFASLIRDLELGQAVISSLPVDNVNRCFVASIRPRVAMHGGFEE